MFDQFRNLASIFIQDADAQKLGVMPDDRFYPTGVA